MHLLIILDESLHFINVLYLLNQQCFLFQIRKLEFLMATALANKCDSVITMGGLQSNHCRATAVISRQLGIQPHLLLRSKDMVYFLN